MIFSVIDVETTGGNPKSSKITEIAIYKHDGVNVIGEFESLVNPEMPIPEFVSNLTGITDEMVANSPKFYEIAKEIIEFTKGTVFVAHNVSFDYGMIRSEYKRLGYDFRLPHLCTVQTSRKLLPDMESYSLGKLTRSLGIALKGRHRAGGDALATAKLLTHLMETDDVTKFIQEEIDVNELHPLLNMEEIEEIPNKPGIYKFFDENNQLIYIGKGKYIRTQIEQHLKNSTQKKSAAWGKNIARVEFELTGNELVAAIIEHQLLQRHSTPYNKKSSKTTKQNLFDEDLAVMDFNGESFFILRKGRTKFERSILYVENGQFVGFGYCPFHMNHQLPIYWKRYIQTTTTTDDFIQHIIYTAIRKEKIDKIKI
ncbi:MAG TPA: exonuclease domain-containing protein [Taishania sp.]|nr:exonuclease domain-containing protein [Taishania sp.]